MRLDGKSHDAPSIKTARVINFLEHLPFPKSGEAQTE